MGRSINAGEVYGSVAGCVVWNDRVTTQDADELPLGPSSLEGVVAAYDDVGTYTITFPESSRPRFLLSGVAQAINPSLDARLISYESGVLKLVVASKFQPIPAWTAELAVTDDAVEVGTSAWVTNVVVTDAGMGSDTGAAAYSVVNGVPAVGQVGVAYDADGKATLTFHADDEVAEASVLLLNGSFLPYPAWTDEIAVTADEAELTSAGFVTNVVVTDVAAMSATDVGPYTIVNDAPAAGQVQVAYTDGVATLTFHEDDNVLEASVQKLFGKPETRQVPAWSDALSVSMDTETLAAAGFVTNVFVSDGGMGTTGEGSYPIVDGTPAVGEVQVEYDAAGIATLTFHADDTVAEASVQVFQVPTLEPVDTFNEVINLHCLFSL